LLSLWASKEKVTRAPAGVRNARCISGQVATTAPSRYWIPAYAEMTNTAQIKKAALQAASNCRKR
ncbi:hypothetical protein, partial [Dyella sp. SG609]|uniref:hypothetical protein n=1 Tax=Dyella sp. SG609 TaxID=2587018 RepID=UPI001B2FF471